MRLQLLMLTMLLAGFSSMCCARDDASRERDVLKADTAICHAFEVGDGVTLAKMLDEKFTLTNSHGEIGMAKETIAEVAKREPKYETFRNRDQKVRIYGDTAVVNGVTMVKGTAAGEPFSADFQFTDTWILRSGAWILVASHASRLAK